AARARGHAARRGGGHDTGGPVRPLPAVLPAGADVQGGDGDVHRGPVRVGGGGRRGGLGRAVGGSTRRRRSVAMDVAANAAGSRLSAVDVTLAYGRAGAVAENLTLRVPDGVVTSIIGPNGCGKSTLLRALARLIAPAAGTVLLDGEAIHRLP